MCEVRTEEPWLTISWVQRSIRELLELVRADKGADGVETLHDSTIQPDELRSLEAGWDLVSPRWVLTFTTTNDARPSFIIFSGEPTVPAMLHVPSPDSKYVIQINLPLILGLFSNICCPE